MLEPQNIEHAKKRLGKVRGADKIKFGRQLLCPTTEAEAFPESFIFLHCDVGKIYSICHLSNKEGLKT
jgi:hypothetical protein